MISKEGSHYVLRAKHGSNRVLGKHKSLASAQAQERAIQAHKHAKDSIRSRLKDAIKALVKF